MDIHAQMWSSFTRARTCVYMCVTFMCVCACLFSSMHVHEYRCICIYMCLASANKQNHFLVYYFGCCCLYCCCTVFWCIFWTERCVFGGTVCLSFFELCLQGLYDGRSKGSRIQPKGNVQWTSKLCASCRDTPWCLPNHLVKFVCPATSAIPLEKCINLSGPI